MRRRYARKGLIIGLVIGFFIGYVFAYVIDSWTKVSLPKDYEVYIMNDRDYFRTAHKVLSNAENRIYIIMYEIMWYNKENSVMQLVYLIGEKAKNGLDVKIILEYSYYSDSLNENNTKVKKYLESCGAKIKFDSPKITTHCKLVIVDGKIVIIGSTNWSYSAFEKNHECAIAICDKNLAEKYEEYFNNLWNSL